MILTPLEVASKYNSSPILDKHKMALPNAKNVSDKLKLCVQEFRFSKPGLLSPFMPFPGMVHFILWAQTIIDAKLF